MLAKCHSGALCGVEARTVEIEVCSSDGSPQFTMVGLPDQAVKEAKDRVSTAIGNSGFKKIESNITVNLAPADVRKEGPFYDLPIAVSLLAATGKIHAPDLGDYAPFRRGPPRTGHPADCPGDAADRQEGHARAAGERGRGERGGRHLRLSRADPTRGG